MSASGFLPENIILFYLKTPDRQWDMTIREKSKPVYAYLRKIDSQTREADGSQKKRRTAVQQRTILYSSISRTQAPMI